jgi:hypothetical protein
MFEVRAGYRETPAPGASSSNISRKLMPWKDERILFDIDTAGRLPNACWRLQKSDWMHDWGVRFRFWGWAAV